MENGGKYTVELEIEQVAADEHRATFHVASLTASDQDVQDDEPAEEPEAKPPKTMKAMPGYAEAK